MLSSTRKYRLKKRPVYEITDKRASERYKNEEYKRRRARKETKVI